MKVISIDVGIKNLAFCILERHHGGGEATNGSDDEAKNWKIVKWDIINLCGEEKKCGKCKSKAKYFRDDQFYCQTHAKQQTAFIVPDPCFAPGKLKKQPLDKLKQLCVSYELVSADQKPRKDDLFKMLEQHALDKMLHIITAPSANNMDIVSLGAAILKEFDDYVCPLLSDTDEIIIENQISPIANRMKTLQGMIAQYFIMRNKPDIKFISAANKLKGYDVVTDSYADRKKAGVDITKELLSSSQAAEWTTFFTNHKKKDDLADSFLQGMWYIKRQRNGIK